MRPNRPYPTVSNMKSFYHFPSLASPSKTKSTREYYCYFAIGFPLEVFNQIRSVVHFRSVESINSEEYLRLEEILVKDLNVKLKSLSFHLPAFMFRKACYSQQKHT